MAALLPLPLAAQSAASRQLPPLTAVTVSGSARFDQAQLVAATGLHQGQAMSLNAMNQAAKRLNDSGDFAGLTYRYTYSAQGTQVRFQVTDRSHLLPVEFDNFVWLPRKQLLQLLRGKIPLFSGKVPLAGTVDQKIAAALQSFLRQRGLKQATVQGMPFQAKLGTGSIDSYEFSVRGVKIPVRQVDFPGAPPGLTADLQKKVASLIGQDFSRERLNVVIQAMLLPVLRNRGFLQAKFAAPAVQLTDPATNTVSVTLAVDAGAQVRWGAIGFQGNRVFDAKKLQKLVKLHRGKLADEAALHQDIAAIQKLYRNAGYLHAAVTPQFDFSKTGVAAATLVIREGQQFRMGKLSLKGVAGNAAKELAGLWRLAPGQPYRAGYLQQYLRSLYRHFDFHGASIQTEVAPDEERHLVNVTIALSKSSPGGGA